MGGQWEASRGPVGGQHGSHHGGPSCEVGRVARRVARTVRGRSIRIVALGGPSYEQNDSPFPRVLDQGHFAAVMLWGGRAILCGTMLQGIV